jgi:hypothetical protein
VPSTDECQRTPRRARGSPGPLPFVLAATFPARASRHVPHRPNLAPIDAIALFGGASFADHRAAFPAPLGAMIASDITAIPFFRNTRLGDRLSTDAFLAAHRERLLGGLSPTT